MRQGGNGLDQWNQGRERWRGLSGDLTIQTQATTVPPHCIPIGEYPQLFNKNKGGEQIVHRLAITKALGAGNVGYKLSFSFTNIDKIIQQLITKPRIFFMIIHKKCFKKSASVRSVSCQYQPK